MTSWANTGAIRGPHGVPGAIDPQGVQGPIGATSGAGIRWGPFHQPDFMIRASCTDPPATPPPDPGPSARPGSAARRLPVNGLGWPGHEGRCHHCRPGSDTAPAD